MLADYWKDGLGAEVPDAETELKTLASITYNGTAPTVKVGGSYKIFTPVFHDKTATVDKWTISDENGDITSDTENYAVDYDGDKLKLKVAKNYYLIGKELIVQVKGTDGSTAELRVGVV